MMLNKLFDELEQYDLTEIKPIVYDNMINNNSFSNKNYNNTSNFNYIIYNKREQIIKYFNTDDFIIKYYGNYYDDKCYIINPIHNFNNDVFYQIFYNFSLNYLLNNNYNNDDNNNKNFICFEKYNDYYSNIILQKNPIIDYYTCYLNKMNVFEYKNITLKNTCISVYLQI